MSFNVKIATCIGLILLSMVVSFSGVTRPAHDEIVSNLESFDFGSVGPEGLRKVFEITNSSSREIHISGAETTCKCASVHLQPGPIRPGESVQLEVGFKPFSGSGVTRARILLIEEAQSKIHKVMEVTGRSIMPPSARPPHIQFGLVRQAGDHSEMRAVRLITSGKRVTEINVNDLCGDRFSAELVPAGAGAYTLEARLCEGATGGLFDGTASVDVTFSSGEIVKVPILGRTASMSYVSPPALSFLSFPAGTSSAVSSEVTIETGKQVDSLSLRPAGLSDAVSVDASSDKGILVSTNKLALVNNQIERGILVIQFTSQDRVAVPIDLWVRGGGGVD